MKNVYKKRGTVEKENGHNTKKKGEQKWIKEDLGGGKTFSNEDERDMEIQETITRVIENTRKNILMEEKRNMKRRINEEPNDL